MTPQGSHINVNGEWHHVVYVNDDAAAGSRVYLDGHCVPPGGENRRLTGMVTRGLVDVAALTAPQIAAAYEKGT